MSARALLERCQMKGVVLTANGDRLGYSAPTGALSSADKSELAQFKSELLAMIRCNDPQPMAIEPDLEAITEKAGAFFADGLSHDQADVAAVRLVQCRTCQHFTANERTPEAGMGSCAVKAWPQSVTTEPSRLRSWAPYPASVRICDSWGSAPFVRQ